MSLFSKSLLSFLGLGSGVMGALLGIMKESWSGRGMSQVQVEAVSNVLSEGSVTNLQFDSQSRPDVDVGKREDSSSEGELGLSASQKSHSDETTKSIEDGEEPKLGKEPRVQANLPEKVETQLEEAKESSESGDVVSKPKVSQDEGREAESEISSTDLREGEDRNNLDELSEISTSISGASEYVDVSSSGENRKGLKSGSFKMDSKFYDSLEENELAPEDCQRQERKEQITFSCRWELSKPETNISFSFSKSEVPKLEGKRWDDLLVISIYTYLENLEVGLLFSDNRAEEIKIPIDLPKDYLQQMGLL
ncbi:hypothetical protein OVS_04255 [Mycoplasma ovis str. Michigan]|uniref:Uncharacterized protein n=1 Tax=Mycoplasma ovis str. Michigan TaxID=1415773 RepID=A0ABM5P290_9MOLU|nr:hypothetical protein [Mycoplasma ovis]AHC40578.1 hypothetical protein OVS_04255 [Mycoplasma ovis str. Michigan]